MIANLLISTITNTLVTTMILIALGFLLRNWIANRLKIDIQHEADKKLETFKATLKEQTDSAFLTLNSELQSIISIHTVALSSFSEGQKADMERKLNALDTLWDATLASRNTLPKVLNFIDILAPGEYKDACEHTEFKRLMEGESLSEIIIELANLRRKCESGRIYVGEYVWSVFISYQYIMGRIIFLLDKGRKDPNKMEWDRDQTILNLLKSFLTEEEMHEFSNLPVAKISWIERNLESKILLSASSVISGKGFGEETLKNIKDILNNLPPLVKN